MARFMIRVSYTLDGAKGVLADGGTGRRAAVATALESIGGSLESFDFALGQDDAYLIAQVPDNTAAAALSLRVAAGGGARIATVPLLTPEEMDDAVSRGVSYTPPGS
jgi:uncharacterized protein with GYD domain